jgi:hypothetical protein
VYRRGAQFVMQTTPSLQLQMGHQQQRQHHPTASLGLLELYLHHLIGAVLSTAAAQ